MVYKHAYQSKQINKNNFRYIVFGMSKNLLQAVQDQITYRVVFIFLVGDVFDCNVFEIFFFISYKNVDRDVRGLKTLKIRCLENKVVYA